MFLFYIDAKIIANYIPNFENDKMTLLIRFLEKLLLLYLRPSQVITRLMAHI